MRNVLPLEWGHAEFDPVAIVPVGDRALPRITDVHFYGGEDQPALKMRIEVRSGVPLCTALSLESGENVREVRSTDLRRIRIADWVEQVVAALAGKIDGTTDGETKIRYGQRSQAELAAARRVIREARRGTRRNVERLLPRVAEIYRDNVDDRPVESIQAAFGVSYRTAGRYAQQARDAGLLPPTTPGRKKA